MGDNDIVLYIYIYIFIGVYGSAVAYLCNFSTTSTKLVLLEPPQKRVD